MPGILLAVCMNFLIYSSFKNSDTKKKPKNQNPDTGTVFLLLL